MEPEGDIALIGLAVMGQNLILNMNDHGFTVVAFNRTVSKVDEFLSKEAKGTNVIGAHSLEEMVGLLKKPRRVMLMVKAGPAVDEFIEHLLPHLEPGDIIIDGGNSLFEDTMRRTKYVESKGLLYIGTGVSGGEEGARRGPSIMPGGSPAAWPHVKDVFQKIAAKVEDGTPCCDWVGENGAGHYVKMVHNGIEYGDMQLICEAYGILKNVLGLEAKDLADIFAQWNRGALESYLIEITAEIFRKRDPDTGKALVDVILDKAGQKGTGLWTLQSALSQSVVISTINAAVEARVISSRKEERVAASKILPQPQVPTFSGNRDELVQAVHDALYASKIVSYAQGMELLGAASTAYNWNLNFGDIATIWRGGCIIRAKFLNRITEAYARDPKLHNLLLDQYFTDIIAKTQHNWRVAVSTAINYGVAAPAFSASLAYFDSYRSARLPANLLQAQRDFFGAHTYERVDKPGIFHTDWMGDQPAQEISEPKLTAKRHAGE